VWEVQSGGQQNSTVLLPQRCGRAKSRVLQFGIPEAHSKIYRLARPDYTGHLVVGLLCGHLACSGGGGREVWKGVQARDL